MKTKPNLITTLFGFNPNDPDKWDAFEVGQRVHHHYLMEVWGVVTEKSNTSMTVNFPGTWGVTQYNRKDACRTLWVKD